MSEKPANKIKMQQRIEKVQQWLDAVPATDNPFAEKSKTERSETWEEWIKNGKTIPNVEDILIEMLGSKDSLVDIKTVLVAIGLVGSKKSFPFLSVFLDDKNLVLRMEAITALGNLQIPEAVPLLCKLLYDKDFNVRANACTALGKFGKEADAIICLERALQDENEFVQLAAQRALKGM